MACTRFYYDDARTLKALQQATDPGRWVLNVPGNGPAPGFMEDPQIILQKWGANQRTNMTDLESDLKGVNRTLTRDCTSTSTSTSYQPYDVSSEAIAYPSCKALTTEQSLTTHPAWWYRDAEQPRWTYLPLNPQANTCLPFQNNLSTRILEKDAFTPKRDCVLKKTNLFLPTSHSLIH